MKTEDENVSTLADVGEEPGGQSPLPERVSCIPAAHPSAKWIRLWWVQLVLGAAILCIATIWHLVFWLSLFIVAGWIHHIRSRMRRQERLLEGMSRESESNRLVCYGNRDELEAMRELSDELFEPLTIRNVQIDEPPTRVAGVLKYCLLAGMIAIWIVLGCAGYSNEWIIGFMILASLFAEWALSMIRPVYLRVVPGRIEIVRTRALHRGSRIEVIHLADKKIRCHFEHVDVIISPIDDKDLRFPGTRQSARLLLSGIEDDVEFVQHVFRAAICRRPAPEYSDWED